MEETSPIKTVAGLPPVVVEGVAVVAVVEEDEHVGHIA